MRMQPGADLRELAEIEAHITHSGRVSPPSHCPLFHLIRQYAVRRRERRRRPQTPARVHGLRRCRPPPGRHRTPGRRPSHTAAAFLYLQVVRVHLGSRMWPVWLVLHPPCSCLRPALLLVPLLFPLLVDVFDGVLLPSFFLSPPSPPLPPPRRPHRRRAPSCSDFSGPRRLKSMAALPAACHHQDRQEAAARHRPLSQPQRPPAVRVLPLQLRGRRRGSLFSRLLVRKA